MKLEIQAADFACPNCNSGFVRAFAAPAHDRADGQSIEVKECQACFFAWQYPVNHSPHESAAYFEQAYADAAMDPTSYFNPRRRRAVAEIQAAFVESLHVSGATLLDVGGGNGYFARAAKAQGWDVTLVDPALDPASFAGTGITAICGTMSDLPRSEFDVVTLWDVIEHVPEPGPFLRMAVQCLKPGGKLILETGNYKSADRAADGVAHWIYQADHRWYFAPDSAKSLMEAAGLCNVQLYPAVMRPGWAGQVDYPGPSLIQSLRRVASTPSRLVQTIATHRRLSQAGRWPASGLSIFTLHGTRG